MKKVRITVKRIACYRDLMEEYENPRSAMLSCNDGFRPVSFLLEALEEDAD